MAERIVPTNPRHVAYVLLLLLPLLAGCDSQPDQPFGFHSVQATDADDSSTSTSYAIFRPQASDPNTKLPVILFLNGWGENGDDGLRQISNNFGGDVWRMRGHFPFLAVCPQCAYNGSWAVDSPNTREALRILDDAIAQYNGDRDRVYITGASVGGSGALAIATAYPDRFAAVIPVAAGGGGDAEILAAAQIPIWSFYNAGDAASLVRSARTSRRELLAAGLSPLVTEFPRGGHDAWNPAYGSPALYAWLLEHDRSQHADQGRFQLISPNKLLANWDARGELPWSTQEDELIAPVDGEGESLLLSPEIAGNAEWHLDLFAEQESSHHLLVLGTDETDERVEIVLESSETGLGGIRRGTETWMATLDPVAQRAWQTGWNDVRIERANGTLDVRINGRPAAQVDDPFAGQPIRWGLTGNDADEPARYRFIRLRNASPDDAKGGS